MTFSFSTPMRAMDDEQRDSAHLSAEDLAVFVDGTSSAALQSRVEVHLADCEECRAEAVAVSRLMRARSPRRRF
jgi:anti-sigma factor RsiW